MSLASISTFRVHPNDHIDYMKAVPLSEVTFKEETMALHTMEEDGTLNVIEGAEKISTEQILAEMSAAQICIIEIDKEKIGYYIGNLKNGFYLGPEVDLEFLRDNKPEIFENIKTEGSGIGGAQPQMQPQLAATPSVPGGTSGNTIQSGDTQGGGMPGGVPGGGAGGAGGEVSMDDLMEMLKAQKRQEQQGG